MNDNISKVEYIIDEDIVHVKYTNLFYVNKNFIFVTTDKNLLLKPVKLLGGPEHSGIINSSEYIFKPIIQVFNDIDELNSFVKTYTIKNIDGITNYFSHYYDHNIAHGLYDALYPSFLTLILFYSDYNIKYNNLINLLHIRGWRFNSNASREFVLDIFNNFSKGNILFKNKLNENYKFETIIAGSGCAGLSSVNKNGVMPGKYIFALEKFRNRMLGVYNIKKNINENKIINVLILDSHRYSKLEKNILNKLNNKLLSMGYNSKYISWINIPSFKEQLEIINNTDIQISGAGTTMLYFPFLSDNKIHVNLGVNNLQSNTCSLLEVNCCLLSNNIYCVFYDIHKYKEILYDPLFTIINENIKNINSIDKKTVAPIHIDIWKEYCEKDKNMSKLIKKLNGEDGIHLIKSLNGEGDANLIGYRHSDILVYEYYPYDEKNKLINNKLLREIVQSKNSLK